MVAYQDQPCKIKFSKRVKIYTSFKNKFPDGCDFDHLFEYEHFIKVLDPNSTSISKLNSKTFDTEYLYLSVQAH